MPRYFAGRSYRMIYDSNDDERIVPFIETIATTKGKVKTYQREICPLYGCSLVLRDEEDNVRLLAAASRGHRTAVSQTTCKRKEKEKKTCCIESLSHRWFSGQKSSVKVRSINLQITFTVGNSFSGKPRNEGQLI